LGENSGAIQASRPVFVWLIVHQVTRFCGGKTRQESRRPCGKRASSARRAGLWSAAAERGFLARRAGTGAATPLWIEGGANGVHPRRGCTSRRGAGGHPDLRAGRWRGERLPSKAASALLFPPARRKQVTLPPHSIIPPCGRGGHTVQGQDKAWIWQMAGGLPGVGMVEQERTECRCRVAFG